MLMNIQTLKWDPSLCKVFNIPMEVLPEIRSSSEIYGHMTQSALKGVPISGVSRKFFVTSVFANHEYFNS